MWLVLWALGCGEGPPAGTADPSGPPLGDDVIAAIDIRAIKDHVDVLAHDDLAGRTPGSEGHAIAKDILVAALDDAGLEPLNGSYEHTFDMTPPEDRYTLDDSGQVVRITTSQGTNLVAVLPGTDPVLSEQYIVVMAHYDHLGTDAQGHIYNGAFNDIVGVAALLELGRAFVAEAVPLRRSILVVLTDGEESGLLGSEAWLADPPVPLHDIVLGLSIDPIGRGVLPEHWPVVLLGAERAPSLKQRLRELAAWTPVDVAFVNRTPIPFYASDQDSFYELEVPIPAVWFTSPGMTWYHTTDDTPQTIDYRSVTDHVHFIAQLLAGLANDDAPYDWAGARPLSVEDAADAVQLLQGVAAQPALTDAERHEANGYIADLQAVVDADDLAAVGDIEAVYLQSAFYLLFTLTQNHPGPVPPPLPDDF